MTKCLFIIALIIPIISFADLSDKQLISIYREVKCVVCTAQSIAESNTEHAQILKDFIKDKAQKGATQEEIKQFLVDKFGPSILFTPPSEGLYKILWLFPYILVCVFLYFVIRNYL